MYAGSVRCVGCSHMRADIVYGPGGDSFRVQDHGAESRGIGMRCFCFRGSFACVAEAANVCLGGSGLRAFSGENGEGDGTRGRWRCAIGRTGDRGLRRARVTEARGLGWRWDFVQSGKQYCEINLGTTTTAVYYRTSIAPGVQAILNFSFEALAAVHGRPPGRARVTRI